MATGAADLGITGHNMVLERGVGVEELLDLKRGRARPVLAVKEDAPIKSVRQLDGTTVATEFPVITRQFFWKKGIKADIVLVRGACEAAPHLGIADVIIDLTSPGTTLKTNWLRIIGEVLETSTGLIANRDSLLTKSSKIEEIRRALESVIRARGQGYLMMNAKRSSLETVKKVLPELSGPTVMDVASHEDLVAVHAVVSDERAYTLINALKRAGAKNILVMAIQRMIRGWYEALSSCRYLKRPIRSACAGKTRKHHRLWRSFVLCHPLDQ